MPIKKLIDSGMDIVARGGPIVALVGDIFEARTRSAFDSEDSFFCSVGYGQSDIYTFNTLEEAARFAKGKIDALAAIERSIDTKQADAAESLKIRPIAVPSPGRRRKHA